MGVRQTPPRGGSGRRRRGGEGTAWMACTARSEELFTSQLFYGCVGSHPWGSKLRVWSFVRHRRPGSHLQPWQQQRLLPSQRRASQSTNPPTRTGLAVCTLAALCVINAFAPHVATLPFLSSFYPPIAPLCRFRFRLLQYNPCYFPSRYLCVSLLSFRSVEAYPSALAVSQVEAVLSTIRADSGDASRRCRHVAAAQQ